MKSATALFISPHLDDAAFSCGGTLIEMARRGWRTILCTVFTASVSNPVGFALACQTDKGLPPEVDYMKLRRAEDREFARTAEVTKVINIELPEAPHRGYASAPALFAGIHRGDEVWREVLKELQLIVAGDKPKLIFAPQGIGNHVDHLQTIIAVQKLDRKAWWYRDTPYTIRYPNAARSDLLRNNLTERFVNISDALEQKIAGCAAYRTQIDFQFGGAEQLRDKLTMFHREEAGRIGRDGFVERFLV